MKSPCKDCRRRKLNCHGICKEYQEYREKVDAIHAEKEKQRNGNPQNCTRVYRSVSKWLNTGNRWRFGGKR